MKFLISLVAVLFITGTLSVPVTEVSEAPKDILQKVLEANPQENDIGLTDPAGNAPSDVNSPVESKPDEESTSPTPIEEEVTDAYQSEIDDSKSNVDNTETLTDTIEEQSVNAEVGEITSDPNNEVVSVFEPTTQVESEPLPKPKETSTNVEDNSQTNNNELNSDDKIGAETEDATDSGNTDQNSDQSQIIMDTEENVEKTSDLVDEAPAAVDYEVEKGPMTEVEVIVENPSSLQNANDYTDLNQEEINYNLDYDYGDPLYEESGIPYGGVANVVLSPGDTLPLEPGLMEENPENVPQQEMLDEEVAFESTIPEFNPQMNPTASLGENEAFDGSVLTPPDMMVQGFGIGPNESPFEPEQNEGNLGPQQPNEEGLPEEGPLDGNMENVPQENTDIYDQSQGYVRPENPTDMNLGYFRYESQVNFEPNSFDSYQNYESPNMKLFDPSTHYSNAYAMNNKNAAYYPWQKNSENPNDHNQNRWRFGEGLNYDNAPYPNKNQDGFPSLNYNEYSGNSEDKSDNNRPHTQMNKETPQQTTNRNFNLKPIAGVVSFHRQTPMVELPLPYPFKYSHNKNYFYGNQGNRVPFFQNEAMRPYFDNSVKRRINPKPLIIIIDTTNRHNPENANAMTENLESPPAITENENPQIFEENSSNDEGILLTEYPHNVDIPYSPAYHPATFDNPNQYSPREGQPWYRYGNNYTPTDYDNLPAANEEPAFYPSNPYQLNYDETYDNRDGQNYHMNNPLHYHKTNQNYHRWNPKNYNNQPYY